MVQRAADGPQRGGCAGDQLRGGHTGPRGPQPDPPGRTQHPVHTRAQGGARGGAGVSRWERGHPRDLRHPDHHHPHAGRRLRLQEAPVSGDESQTPLLLLPPSLHQYQYFLFSFLFTERCFKVLANFDNKGTCLKTLVLAIQYTINIFMIVWHYYFVIKSHSQLYHAKVITEGGLFSVFKIPSMDTY